MLTMDEYEANANKTAMFAYGGLPRLVYFVGKLNGEAGETNELVLKAYRDEGGHFSPDRKAKLAYELGDCLWYVAAAARELGFSLEQIAQMNIEKLERRVREGKIGGEGSDR